MNGNLLRHRFAISRHDGCASAVQERRGSTGSIDGSRDARLGIAGCAEASSHRVAALLLKAQEDERARIGRELHDGVGQELALLIASLRAANERPILSEELGSELSRICTQAEKLGKLVRGIAHDLHPAKLRYLGLALAVESLCREYSVAYGLEIECRCNLADAKLDPPVSLAVYRVLQEGLRNVAKHSGATRAKVQLSCEREQLILRVSDGGRGFNTDDSELVFGLGIVSMQERVHAIGGNFEIVSTPGFGTRVQVKVPQPIEH
jgi:signal transduction histidine kinase